MNVAFTSSAAARAAAVARSAALIALRALCKVSEDSGFRFLISFIGFEVCSLFGDLIFFDSTDEKLLRERECRLPFTEADDGDVVEGCLRTSGLESGRGCAAICFGPF